MPDIASLAVVVTADTTAAEKGLSDLGTKVSGIGSTIGTALGGAAIAGVAGLGAAFVGSVKSAADFEKQMSAIGAVSGATQTEMDALTKTALQLGKDTSFSASEAAKGMEELAKAGVSTADIIGGAGRAALDLAAAGAVSVADAAEIASNAMNVFNIAGSDMAHVADTIAGAANASAISVTDYKFSLSAAGAVAATVGIGFEDLSTAIAVMGQAGIKGSDAGTSLKTMMLNLQPTTEKQIGQFRELGILTTDTQKAMAILAEKGITPASDSIQDIIPALIRMHAGVSQTAEITPKMTKAFNESALATRISRNEFFTAEGSAKSMAEIAEVLQESMSGLTDQQRLMALETMFGSDAIRAGAVMAKAGAEGFNAMAESMSKVTAQAVAEERLNNLWGSLEKLKGSLETGAIILGSLFTPALKSMADVITANVNIAVDALSQIPDVLATIQQVFGEGWEPGESIHPFTNAVGILALTFRDELWPAIQPVAAFIMETLIPAFQEAGRFIAAHPGLIAALVAAWGTFVVITTVVGWIMSAIAAFTALSGVITASGGVIAVIVTALGGPLTLAIAGIALAVGLLVVAWTENWFGIQEITAQAIAFISAAFDAWLISMQAVWNLITTATTAAWTLISDAFTSGVATIQGLWDAGWAAVQATLTAAWNLLSAENQTRITEIITLMTELWTTLGQLWTVGTAALTTLLTTWWAATMAYWIEQQTTLATTIETWWTTVQTTWTAALTVITDALAAAWTLIDEQTGGMLTGIGTKFTEAKTWLGQAAADLGTAIMDMLIGAVNAKVGAMLDAVTGAVQGALDSARRLVGGASGSGAVGNQQWAQIAREEGVDPALLLSMIEQESGGSQGARSGAGAIGLTQLMPGTAASLGVDPYDELQNVRGGARYLKQMLDQFGDPERALAAYNAGPGGGVPAASAAYARRVVQGAANIRVPSAVANAQRQMTPQIGQFSLQGGSLSAEEAMAFCGPAAAMWFANIYGRMPDKAEAEAMARSVGWTPFAGMAGPGSQQRLLSAMGIPTNLEAPSTARIAELAAQNVPFQLSTDGHYYQVQGGGLGGLNVGASGTALKGGAATMSLDQIIALSGAINGIITLAPQMGQALATASATGGAALQGLLVSATTLSDGTTVAITQMGSQITASIVNSSGQVVATYGAMTTAVTEQTAAMSTGVLTSVTDLGGAIMTSTQDAAGNVVITITDMAGNVTSQYTQMATDVAAVATEQTTAVTEQAASMSEQVLTSVTDLGTGTLTVTQNSAGEVIATITDMAGNVTSQYTTMSNETVATAAEMGAGFVGEMQATGEGIQTEAETWTQEIRDALEAAAEDARDDARAIGEGIWQGVAEGVAEGTGEVAEAVENLVDEAIDAGEEKSESDSPSKLFARELGLPIAQGVAAGIEKGSGLVADATAGLIGVPAVPSYGSAGGGGTQTIVLKIDIGGRVAEEIYVTGRELAISRGRA